MKKRPSVRSFFIPTYTSRPSTGHMKRTDANTKENQSYDPLIIERSPNKRRMTGNCLYCHQEETDDDASHPETFEWIRVYHSFVHSFRSARENESSPPF